MSSPLAAAIAGLSSAVPSVRQAAAEEVYRLGRATAGIAVSAWWADEELSALLQGPQPTITPGVAVQRETFNRIRIANGTPRLAEVPPDQDAEEFELHFSRHSHHARARRLGRHCKIPRQIWRGLAAGGVSVRKCGPRHGNLEGKI